MNYYSSLVHTYCISESIQAPRFVFGFQLLCTSVCSVHRFRPDLKASNVFSIDTVGTVVHNCIMPLASSHDDVYMWNCTLENLICGKLGDIDS